LIGPSRGAPPHGAATARGGLLPAVPAPTEKVVITGGCEAYLEQSLVFGADAEPEASQRVLQRLDLDRYQRWSCLQIAPFVVRQTLPLTTSSEDGLIRQWTSPGSKVDRHYGYAFQWFAMSIAMLAFWAWLTFIRRPTGAPKPTP